MTFGRSYSEKEFGCHAQLVFSHCFFPSLSFFLLNPPSLRFVSIRHFRVSPPPLSTCEYKTILQPGLLLGENPDQFFFIEKNGTSMKNGPLNTKSIYPIRKKFSEISENRPMISVRTVQRGVNGEVKCLLNPIELTLEPEV